MLFQEYIYIYSGNYLQINIFNTIVILISGLCLCSYAVMTLLYCRLYQTRRKEHFSLQKLIYITCGNNRISTKVILIGKIFETFLFVILCLLSFLSQCFIKKNNSDTVCEIKKTKSTHNNDTIVAIISTE